MAVTPLTPVIFDLTTTESDIIAAVPSGETWTITFGSVANIDGTNNADAELYLHNGTSQGALVKGATVEAKKALVFTTGREIVLPTGSKLRGKASANSDLQVILTGYKRT